MSAHVEGSQSAPVENNENAEKKENPAPVIIAEVKKARKTREGKTHRELIAEFGRISLKRDCEDTIPSDKHLEAIEAQVNAIAKAHEDFANTPEQFQRLAKMAIEGMEFKLSVMREKLGNPSSVSADTKRKLSIAARRLMKTESASLVSIAIFVQSNLEVFPVKGTKY